LIKEDVGIDEQAAGVSLGLSQNTFAKSGHLS